MATATSDSTAVDDASKQAPSGFVLKLFQMVNASDNEIIKVRACCWLVFREMTTCAMLSLFVVALWVIRTKSLSRAEMVHVCFRDRTYHW